MTIARGGKPNAYEFWKNQKGVVIGFPNNNLKNEHYSSSGLPANEKMVTPEAISKFSVPVRAYLSSLYQRGLNEAAYFKIKDLAIGKSIFDDGKIEYSDMENAAGYLSQNMVINDCDVDKTLFTTHARMVHQQFKHDTYVFDENAFGTLLEQQKTTVKELSIVITHLKLRGFRTDELEKAIESNDLKIYETPCSTDYQEIVKEIVRGGQFNTNVLKFFQSSRYMNDGEFVHYECNYIHKLPSDKKLIFLDATGSPTLFKYLFGDRLEIIDISNVELQGTLLQNTTKSCSKTGLSKYHEKISKEIGALPVITHIDYKKYFLNPVDTFHFGNLMGSNQLTGKDFCVVGTMTYHPTYYRFLAATLNINCNEFNMKNLKVTYNGRCFWFTTFKNPELQRLHLEQVEGELIQGVHRGRLIRTTATVKLYSNFPLLQGKYILK